MQTFNTGLGGDKSMALQQMTTRRRVFAQLETLFDKVNGEDKSNTKKRSAA